MLNELLCDVEVRVKRSPVQGCRARIIPQGQEGGGNEREKEV